MGLDRTFARLLSDFFLDIAKAFFISGFVSSPFLLGQITLPEGLFLLTKTALNVILFLYLAYKFAKLEEVK